MNIWRVEKELRIHNISLILLITGAIFFIPFYFSRLTVDPVLMPRFLAWAILTTVLAGGLFFQGNKNRQGFYFGIISREVFFLAAGYLCVAGLSLVNAVNLAEGIFEWLKIFLSFAFFYIVTVIISSDENGVLILTRAVTIMSSFLALIGILQYFQIAFTHIPGNHLIYATMANKNLNASALFLTLPFILFGIFRFGGIWLVACCTAAAGAFYVISLSETRSVWIAILISGLISSLIGTQVLKHKNLSEIVKSHLRKRSLLILTILVGAILAAALTPVLIQLNNSTFYNGQQEVSTDTLVAPGRPLLSLATLEERVLVWKRTLQMARENPLIGIGTGQWKIILPLYGKIEKFIESQDGIIEVQFVRPHNDFLWVLAENGWTGLGLYLGIFVFLIIYAFRIMLKSGDMSKIFFSLLMLLGIVGYMVIASFSFPKERIFHTMFLMLIAASVVSTNNQVVPRPRKIRDRKLRLFNALLVIFLMISVIVGIARFNSELHTRKALAARQSNAWASVVYEIDRAYSWFYSLDPASTPLMWYRGMANFSLGYRGQALDDFERAYKHHPNHIHVLNNLGTCYALLGQPEKAIGFYRKALEIFPGFERCSKNLRALNIIAKKHTDARENSSHFN